MRLLLLRDMWCKFWFERRSVVPLALFRILFALMTLETLWHFASDFSLFYGVNNLFPIDVVSNLRWEMSPKFDLFLLVPGSDAWHWALFCSFVAAGLLLLFGLFTRFGALWLFFGLITLHTHFQSNFNAGDRYEVLVLLLLALSNAGNALSLDSLLRHRKDDWRQIGFAPEPISGWTIRMLQVQLAVAYCHAFFSKLSGEQWLDGSVIYLVARFHDFHRNSLPFLYDTKIGCKLVDWSTLAIEGALWTLVWIKELRYWVLLAGVFMHLSIELTMEIPVFEGLFMVTYVLFLDEKDLTRLMQSINRFILRLAGPPATLAFDGSCIFCVRSAGLIHRLDIFERLKMFDFRDEKNSDMLAGIDRDRAEREMLVNKGKTWLGGFRAFRWMALSLPLLWPVVPFLYLPGATIPGERLYAWVASRRFNLVGGVCSGSLCEAKN